MSAKFTPLDRVAVQLWLARSGLLTARRQLKREEHRAVVDRLLGEIEGLRASLKARDVAAR